METIFSFKQGCLSTTSYLKQKILFPNSPFLTVKMCINLKFIVSKQKNVDYYYVIVINLAKNDLYFEA